MVRPTVSVLMPCLNPGPFLEEAIASVLAQPDCLELLIADGGSTDGSLSRLRERAAGESRIRLLTGPDQGPADALNRAFQAARGTVIGWLNADDLYTAGALSRAVACLSRHPEWLMVYGEGEEFNSSSGSRLRYPTLPPQAGLKGFVSHCFICQPTVVFRRSMGILLGPFDSSWRTAFDFDYWLRAFSAFPERIGYVPHLQASTRLHQHTITSSQRSRVALEATKLLARSLGGAPATRLHNYALELQLGIASPPPDQPMLDHLDAVFREAEAHLEPAACARLRQDWLLDPVTAPGRLRAESEAAATGWHRSLPGQLLQAWRPQLRLEAAGPPAGPHRRLVEAVTSEAAALPLLQTLHATPAQPEAGERSFPERPFGVNLIGHAFDVFGIGEDIRMAARSLQAADVPCCVIDHPAGNGSARTDRSLETLLHSGGCGGPYAFNLVCMAAPVQARWLLEQGFAGLRERYTLVSWPWETEIWPAAWEPLLQVADELWPSSRFTARALQPHSHAERPLHWMPMAAAIADLREISAPQTRLSTRRAHGLPNDAVIYAYGFDFNSTASRKNPMGVLEAFQSAFPPDGADPLASRVALMIKTFPPRRFKADFQWLQARVAEDPRIHLVVGHLTRHELLRLYGCCDVFVSLHRSEGFGRGLAEALQLGLHVIATDFGGNTDFCTGPLAHPVRYRRVPIPRGAYPCADGHHWAEPDQHDAVRLIREVAQQLLETGHAGEAAEGYRERFSCELVGARYRDRLLQLWADRHQIAERLRWRNDRTPVSF
ncbi:MAG: glycosyltransferase [Cyanobium sp.]|nr:glycosyltransferase [Cyanobium sp.]